MGVVNVFILGVANALTPRTAHAFARGGVNELRRVLITTALLLIAVLGMSFLAMLFAGDRIAVLVYGEQFRGSGPTLATLAPEHHRNQRGNDNRQRPVGTRSTAANLIPDLCGLVVTVIGAVLLVSSLRSAGRGTRNAGRRDDGRSCPNSGPSSRHELLPIANPRCLACAHKIITPLAVQDR